MDAGLKRELEAKIYAGERLNREDGIALYESDDLAWLGRLAHHKRTEANGDRVMFNVNRHLNLTNVCPPNCAYCSFSRKQGDKDAYAMGVEEAVSKAREMAGAGLTELHIVNGIHPGLPWSYFPQLLRELTAALPGVSLQGFTATEVRWFEKISGRPADEILDELMDAGLESLTGADGELFDQFDEEEVHHLRWEDWSRIHRLAHAKGMRTSATMLYGHIEEPRNRVDHVMRLRELQDETGGFVVFIPLRDAGGGTPGRTPVAAPAASLKAFAVSRLMVDNVPHVKCLWSLHGRSVAQLALNFGADDLDGPVVEHEISPDAGATGPMQRDDLLNLVWDAGLRPVERDARYEVVREYDAAPSFADRRSEPQQVWA
jgi:aminodeoxyfutalosine synthase